MKCSRCARRAEITFPYTKDVLCQRCFADLFESRVRKNIRTNRLLTPEDKTAVALSGGKDSAVALHILKKLAGNIPGSEIIAISIDQGIGAFQEKSLEAAKELCKTLKVRHYLYSFREEYGMSMEDIVAKTKDFEKPAPPCSYCGVLRRKLLNDKGRELCVTKIATGHNMDDEIQSGLMNYIRGDFDRIARMGSMVGVMKDEGFVPRIKPLRPCPERETRLYADVMELPYEPSRCPYSGEAFRKTIREVIETIDSNHPGSKFQLLRSNDTLVPLLRKCMEPGRIAHCERCGSPTSGKVCKFCEMSDALGLTVKGSSG